MKETGKEINNIEKEISPVSGKTKFTPKRRTPYLLQEEVIKQKQEKEQEQSNLENTLPTKIPVELNQKSEIDESIEKKIINTQDKVPVVNESFHSGDRIDYMDEISSISGIQKRVLYYFVQCCELRGHVNTGPITSETLCKISNTTHKTLKKILDRMIENKLITRKKGKPGKGGYTKFEVNRDVMDIVRLQISIENNYITNTTSTVSKSFEVRNTDKILPEDWKKIDFKPLIDSFQYNKKIPNQYFGTIQLKSIYSLAGDKLTAKEVQDSINNFAYGYRNYWYLEPYINMKNPAGFLLEFLKNGDIWVEKRYLTADEEITFNIYKNLSNKLDDDIKKHFIEWLCIDKEKKYNKYKKTMRSIDYYDDHVFEEKAWDDYKNNEWSGEKMKILASMIGISNQELICKFEDNLLARTQSKS